MEDRGFRMEKETRGRGMGVPGGLTYACKVFPDGRNRRPELLCPEGVHCSLGLCFPTSM